MKEPWISVKEAAGMAGYSPPYFRDVFCNPERPLVTLRTRLCPSGRRRILVERASVEKLVRDEIKEAIC
jgi:hypothetical protein